MPDYEHEAEGTMTRLTDLIRGQSGQEFVSHDAKSPTRSSEAIDRASLPATTAQATTEIDWYQRAYDEVQGIKRAVQTQQGWTLDELIKIASGVAHSVRATDKLVETVLRRDTEDYLVNNAVNVAIVSVKIAEALRYEPVKLEQVALAGLVHDLGMFDLPETLPHKTSSLTAEEFQSVREHPQIGARLFKKVGEAYPLVARVILQEHERSDGSGYPSQLIGDQIDEMALVIGLADVFDAMISSRPYRRGVAPHRAILALLTKGKTVFPHHLLKALVEQLSVYPIGTTVRLNTGEIGVVSQLNRQYPLRPILQISPLNASTHAPSSKTLDMRTETSLHIVEVVPIG